MTRVVRVAAVIAMVATMMLAARDASAQLRARPLVPDAPRFAVRLYGDGGLDRFAAKRSFNAIFSTDSGPVFGGGVELVLRSAWFVRAGAWRFRDVGERAVRLENRTFRLGIPLTVTIVPVEVTAGYRLPLGRMKRIVPYVGGGVSSHSYKETSEFAEAGENVDERFTGYQLLGGVEYRLHRLFGLAGEVQWTTVPDALGAGGLSAAFDESDLGGVIVRMRVLFGR